jgi:hypothetical protein
MSVQHHDLPRRNSNPAPAPSRAQAPLGRVRRRYRKLAAVYEHSVGDRWLYDLMHRRDRRGVEITRSQWRYVHAAGGTR